jgi:Ca2+/Na+ antiporter
MHAVMDWDSIAFHSFALVSGVFLLVYGADLFVDNVANLARRLGVSEINIALLTVEAEWEEVHSIIFAQLPSADTPSSQS